MAGPLGSETPNFMRGNQLGNFGSIYFNVLTTLIIPATQIILKKGFLNIPVALHQNLQLPDGLCN